jgi:hypothetical protein
LKDWFFFQNLILKNGIKKNKISGFEILNNVRKKVSHI